jgi:hypothetical protein
MTFSLSPTVPIGRIELDAAHHILSRCTPSRQQQALPYLVALYSFMNWWEDYASWQNTSYDQGIEPSTDPEFLDADLEPEVSWDVQFSTTWCERPEIIELIDIADLAIHGTQLSLYPADEQNCLSIHCPTLLGMIKADYCVGLNLAPDYQSATILGFISIEELIEYLKQNPPNAQGFLQLAGSQLHSAYLLPERIGQVQSPVLSASVLVGHSSNPEPKSQAGRKSNRNFSSAPVLDQDKVKQVLQQLSLSGISPFSVEDWNQETAVEILSDVEVCRKVLAVHRLIRAFQTYSEQTVGQEQA